MWISCHFGGIILGAVVGVSVPWIREEVWPQVKVWLGRAHVEASPLLV